MGRQSRLKAQRKTAQPLPDVEDRYIRVKKETMQRYIQDTLILKKRIAELEMQIFALQTVKLTVQGTIDDATS